MTFKHLSLALALLLPIPVAATAQGTEATALPDIGSSAGELLTPKEEEAYGGMMLKELRHYDMLVEDPLLEDYLQELGNRLASRSDRPTQPFTFFMMRSRAINAFATIGGYIGVNAGLFLTAEREDEVAAVMSHEIAHVTQRHVLRAVEAAKKDQLPILLGMLAAAVAASQSGSGDGVQAAMIGGMSLMQQRQIDYTRSNEYEADRIGINTLYRAGYDPVAMADFFGRMNRITRTNSGGVQAPEYLRSHPVTTTRMSEATERATRLVGEGCTSAWKPKPGDAPGGEIQANCTPGTVAAAPRPFRNPLLPDYVSAALDQSTSSPSGLFDLARERLRVLTARAPQEASAEYLRKQRAGEMLSPAQRYGMALALSRAGETAQADKVLKKLAGELPATYWLTLAQAENEHRAGHRSAALAHYERLLVELPRNRAVSLSYATALVELNTVEAARKAQEILRPLMDAHGGDPAFQRNFARASEIAGDTVRAGEAYAEAAWLNGNAEDALRQLQELLKNPNLDYYQRARIDARIASITPSALEMRRRNQRESSTQFGNVGLMPQGPSSLPK
ncbi:MAG: M48 family metalloprotease [Lysobacteraceae bacterium]